MGDLLTEEDYYYLIWEQNKDGRVFDGHFRSQLPDELKLIYDALYQHIIVERRTDDLTIDLSSLDRAIAEDVMRYYWTAEGERDGEHFVDELEDGLANDALSFSFTILSPI